MSLQPNSAYSNDYYSSVQVRALRIYLPVIIDAAEQAHSIGSQAQDGAAFTQMTQGEAMDRDTTDQALKAKAQKILEQLNKISRLLPFDVGDGKGYTSQQTTCSTPLLNPRENALSGFHFSTIRPTPC